MSTTRAETDRDEPWAYGYTIRDIEAMDRFDAFEAGVTAGESRAREQLTGWVLLVGDPRGGFDVIGPFPSQEAAEARGSRWDDDADWWPIELQQRAGGEERARPAGPPPATSSASGERRAASGDRRRLPQQQHDR